MALPNLVSPISIIPSSIYNTGIVATVDATFVTGKFFTVPANTVYILKKSIFSKAQYSSPDYIDGAYERYFYTGRDSGIPNINFAFNKISSYSTASPFIDSGNRIFLENESYYYKINSLSPVCVYFEIDIYK